MNELGYHEELNNLIERVSRRTLQMKANNLRLLNKIGFEMSNILNKIEDLVKSFHADKNEFIKEVELIQYDFIQISKINDKNNSTFQKKKPTEQIFINSNHAQLQTNLQKILVSTSSSSTSNSHSSQSSEEYKENPSEKKNKKKKKKKKKNSSTLESASSAIEIPDTCVIQPESNAKMPATISNFPRFIIRDTIDTNNILSLPDEEFEPILNVIYEISSEEQTNEANEQQDINRKQNENIMDIYFSKSNSNGSYNDLNKLSTQSSAPLSVKKKLQEHGLLDTTNLPQNIIKSSQTKTNKILAGKKHTTKASAPRKKKVSPLKESPTMKQLQLTPDKNKIDFLTRNSISSLVLASPSVISKAIVTQTDCDTNKQNEDEKDKSIDYSFEFRYNNPNMFKDPDETCLESDLLSDVSSDIITISSIKNEPQQKTETEQTNNPRLNTDSKKKQDLNAEFFADFDKVPKKKTNSPNYKYVEVVRKQDERKKLGTSSCKECENYWNSLPENLRPKRMDDACRHRAKYQAPPTPEHYWSIAFPTTQECIERGYGGVICQNDNEDSIAKKRPRRKRPLKLILNENKNKDDESEPASDLDFGEDN